MNQDQITAKLSQIQNKGLESTFSLSEAALENAEVMYGSMISSWWKLFGCEVWTLVLEPIEGHGYWDGKQPFGNLPKTGEYEGVIGVMTRATIRVNKLSSFWRNVGAVANRMAGAE